MMTPNFFLSETPRFFYWIPPNVHLFIGDLLFIASLMKTWGSPMKILGSPMNILGFPMKILRLQWKFGGLWWKSGVSDDISGVYDKKSVSLQWKIVLVFDHNLGVSNENMGTLMKSLGSPMKSLGVFHEISMRWPWGCLRWKGSPIVYSNPNAELHSWFSTQYPALKSFTENQIQH